MLNCIILPKPKDFEPLLLPVITYYYDGFVNAFLLMTINTYRKYKQRLGREFLDNPRVDDAS